MKKLILLVSLVGCIFSSVAQVSEAEKKIALDLVGRNLPVIGLSQNDLGNSIVSHTYIIPGSDVRMLYLQQSYQDIPVYNRLNVLAFRKESMISNTGARIGGIEQKINNASPFPSITPEMAVRAAMADINLNTSGTLVTQEISENGRKLIYGKLDVTLENITAALIWFPAGEADEIRLAWQVFIAPTIGSDYWLIWVNAANGQIITKESLTIYCNWDGEDHKVAGKHKHEPQHFVSKRNTEPNFEFNPFVVNTATYRVIRYPAESPQHPGGAHALHTDPWTMTPGNATTLGWHNNGTIFFDSSRGNNVHAYEDRDNNNLPGFSAVSTTPQPDLTFNFTPNYTVDPTQRTPVPNQQFNTTNLFYWNNLIHDLSYLYGFTETARNFQNSNQGRGGLGLDYVLAEAQDGGGTNNANFATPAEGTRPRMQMYLWTAPTPDRDGDVDNGIIVHEYTHGISNRMTGSGLGCLSNAEQAGEGWSDYFALMMTHDWAAALPNDGFDKPRGIGTYALNQPITGVGIRQYRYTTNMAVNPLTYSNLPSVVHPHGTGTIWCTALWDMTWEIIQTAGINANLFNPAGNGGNAIAFKLVLEGLRLQPCSPGFIDARNAILRADTIHFGAQYSCAIINAFARRGMGVGASQGLSSSRTDQTPSFIGCTPASCNAPTGLASSAITTNSATVSWTAVSGAVSYDVDYKANSSSTWINAATGTASTSVNLTGLSPSILYDWRVRTNCSSSSSAYAQAQFTTAASPCNAPTGLTSSAVTHNSATVSWTTVSGAVSYDVDYKVNSSPTWVNAVTGTGSTSINLSGLSPSTLYDWRVRTNCSSSSSSYAQAQFTTAVAPSGCPGVFDVSTNGTIAGAATIPLNTDVRGLINPNNDNDYYLFQLTTGASVTLTLTTVPADYNLDLLNAGGTRIGRSRNGGTANESITITLAAGDYYARVYPKGNASNATLCYTLHVDNGAPLNELITMSKISVFPNPVNKTVTISIPRISGSADIRVFDVNGRLLIQRNSDQSSTQLDVSALSPGIYLVKVNNRGMESIIKLVKE